MSIPSTNRPGVYSEYSVSSLYTRPKTNKNLALIIKSSVGVSNNTNYLSSYSEAVALIGTADPIALGAAKILFQSGINKLCLVPLANSATLSDYSLAFALVAPLEDIGAIVCDSSDTAIIASLNQSVMSSSANLKERFAVCGAAAAVAAVGVAEAINSERLLMCCPATKLPDLDTASPLFTACAIAGIVLSANDPATSFNGEILPTVNAVPSPLTEQEIESLLINGVTPVELVNKQVECIKAVTTRTKTDDVTDLSFSSINTTLIIDDVIKTIRTSLKSRLKGLKNTVQTRESIVSQVTVELSAKVDAEIIDSFLPPVVYPSSKDSSICVVEISFTVAHVVNQIFISASIKV